MAENKKDRPAPPYLPYRTFSNYVDSLGGGEIPDRIDRSVMGKLSGLMQSQLLAALRYLRLIGEDGKPAETLEKLVANEGQDRQKVFGEVLKAAYPFLFEAGIPLQKATTSQLHEQFEKNGATGDTVRKCVAFFALAARDAGITLSPHVKMPRRGGRRSNAGQRARRGQGVTGNGGGGAEGPPPTPKAQILGDLLAKFPTLDPSWPDEVKAKWFESFQELMKRVQEE